MRFAANALRIGKKVTIPADARVWENTDSLIFA